MTRDAPWVVAIDGPAGAGKSTVARQLAQRLGVDYLDTGAMYRAVTWKALQGGIPLDDSEKLAGTARQMRLEMKSLPDGQVRVTCDGQDISEAVRTPQVTQNTFYAARAPAVREILVDWQRAMGREKSLVAEGRDIGTVVFPDAAVKFYLDADVDERTRRRFEELKARGEDVDFETLRQEIADRDHKDQTRATGPLKVAEDAVVIDSTALTPEAVVNTMLAIVQQKVSCHS